MSVVHCQKPAAVARALIIRPTELGNNSCVSKNRPVRVFATNPANLSIIHYATKKSDRTLLTLQGEFSSFGQTLLVKLSAIELYDEIQIRDNMFAVIVDDDVLLSARFLPLISQLETLFHDNELKQCSLACDQQNRILSFGVSILYLCYFLFSFLHFSIRRLVHKRCYGI